MDNVQMNQKLKVLTSKCDDIKHEKKLLTNDFERLKKYVIISGIISLACIMFYITIIAWCLNSKDPSLKAFGRFQGPFIFAVFVVAFIIFTIRGFDFFVNADTKYSKKMAKKLDKVTVTDRLNDLNSTIMRLELEIGKLENSMYEHRGAESTVDNDNIPKEDMAAGFLEEVTTYGNYVSEGAVYENHMEEDSMSAREQVNSTIYQPEGIQTPEDWGEVQENSGNMVDFFEIASAANATDAVEFDTSGMMMKKAEMQPRVQVQNIKVTEHKDVEDNVFSAGNNNIDDIFNGLDEFWEDEDELENSSELWKQDTMKHYQ